MLNFIYLASSYWSPWIRIPALVVGVLIGCVIVLIGMSMINWGNPSEVRDKKHPKWLPWTMIAIGCLATHAYYLAWDERNVIAAFAESFVALIFYWSLGWGSLAAGAGSGCYIYRKFKLKWLAWAIGIIMFFVVGLSINSIGKKIPGVNWRIEKMEEESENRDY